MRQSRTASCSRTGTSRLAAEVTRRKLRGGSYAAEVTRRKLRGGKLAAENSRRKTRGGKLAAENSRRKTRGGKLAAENSRRRTRRENTPPRKHAAKTRRENTPRKTQNFLHKGWMDKLKCMHMARQGRLLRRLYSKRQVLILYRKTIKTRLYSLFCKSTAAAMCRLRAHGRSRARSKASMCRCDTAGRAADGTNLRASVV